MKIAPYKYVISDNLEKCGNFYINKNEILDFNTSLHILFNDVKSYFNNIENINEITIEFIDSPLPYASIQNCLGQYTINFSNGMRKLLYAFSFLSIIGYQYTCFIRENRENSKAWEIQLKIFHQINELLNNFFISKTYQFDLVSALNDLGICFVHDLQDWSYQAHEIFEGAIRFIISHEIGHIIADNEQGKMKQEEDADKIAIQHLIKSCSFKAEDISLIQYSKDFLESDLYATYKSINFTLFLFMLIDIKQEEMQVYIPDCGISSHQHPSAEHRSNRLLLSNEFLNPPTSSRLLLDFRSSLVYVYSHLKGKVNKDNIQILKAIF